MSAATRTSRVDQLVEALVGLRRLEDQVDTRTRSELGEIRETLEELGGLTVSRAEASRVLGVSQTALDRWINKGAIVAVTTPRGRREVPLREVVDLLLEMDDIGDVGRPLTHVLRRRESRAREQIDLSRLLPSRRPRTHRHPELQSLAYHRLVAERLNEPQIESARRRITKWRASGRIHSHWADEWERVLQMPLAKLREVISADTVSARELRQSSPFAGLLSEHERQRLREAVEARLRA